MGEICPGQPVSRVFEITQADFGALATQPNLRELLRRETEYRL
jgi:hypothetical protein